MSQGEANDPVLLEIDGPIAIVTLNRPKSLNAMSRALSAQLESRFKELQQGGSVKVAIITGAGRAFCAGADLDELSSMEGVLQAADEEIGTGHRRFGMASFDGPVIAAINGVAVTAGLELALCCDMRIASTNARFADTHSRVGVIPGGRMTAMLPRLIGLGRAKEMCLSARMIDAATADRWGLVNRVVEPDELMPAALALAKKIAAVETKYLRTYNRLLDESHERNFADAVDHEHIRSRDANQTFDRDRLDVSSVIVSRRERPD